VRLMIGYLVVGAFFLAVWHFIYERIVAITWRDELRHALFALRDDLRSLKIARPGECPDDLFALLDDSIARWINKLPLLRPSLLLRVRAEYRRNAELRAEVEAATGLIERCRSAEVRRIYTTMQEVLKRALVCNIGGTFLYLVPLALTYYCISAAMLLTMYLTLIPRRKAEGMIPALAAAH